MGTAERNQSGAPGPLADVRVRSLVGLSLWALAVFLAFRFFAAARFVVLGGLGAAAVAATIQPLADHMPGRWAGLRAILAMALVLLAVAGVLVLAVWALYGPLERGVQQLPQIVDRANSGLEDLAADFGIYIDLTVRDVAETGGQLLTGGSVGTWIQGVVSGLLGVGLAVAVVLIGALYLLATPAGTLCDRAVKLLPPSRQEQTRQALRDLQPEYRWWMIGTAVSMVAISVSFGIGFWIIGLEFALPLAIFGGLAQVVPTFGPMVTFAFSLLIAATQGWGHVLSVTVVYVAVQAMESYLLTPMVMRKAVRVPAIVTLFTIILWGNIFGVAGLILAIPLDVTIWAFLKRHLIHDHETAEGDRAPPPRREGA